MAANSRVSRFCTRKCTTHCKLNPNGQLSKKVKTYYDKSGKDQNAIKYIGNYDHAAKQVSTDTF